MKNGSIMNSFSTFREVNYINFHHLLLLLFSHSVMSDSLTPWPVAHQASLPFTIYQSLFKFMSTEPVASSNHLILYCHFSSCLQSFPTSGYFPMSQQFASCSQRIGASTLASVLPMNIQGWSPLVLIGFISLLSKGFSRVFSNTTILWLKTSFHQHSAFFMIQLSHLYMTTGKTIALTRWPIVGKVMSLRFNIPFMFVIASIPRNKGLLILWLQSLSAVILELKKMKSDTVFIFSLSICHEVMGPYIMIFLFWMLIFKPAFPLSSFTFIKRLFSSSSLSSFKVVTFVY